MSKSTLTLEDVREWSDFQIRRRRVTENPSFPSCPWETDTLSNNFQEAAYKLMVNRSKSNYWQYALFARQSKGAYRKVDV